MEFHMHFEYFQLNIFVKVHQQPTILMIQYYMSWNGFDVVCLYHVSYKCECVCVCVCVLGIQYAHRGDPEMHIDLWCGNCFTQSSSFYYVLIMSLYCQRLFSPFGIIKEYGVHYDRDGNPKVLVFLFKWSSQKADDSSKHKCAFL